MRPLTIMRHRRLGLVLAAFVGCSILTHCGGADDPAAKQLAELAVRFAMAEGKGWDQIKIDTARKNKYAFTLTYREPPDNIATVIDDTKKIARHVLTHLAANGGSPARDHLFLWVWAQAPAGRGETGAQLVHAYGHLEYNDDYDRLDFKPWKP